MRGGLARLGYSFVSVAVVVGLGGLIALRPGLNANSDATVSPTPEETRSVEETPWLGDTAFEASDAETAWLEELSARRLVHTTPAPTPSPTPAAAPTPEPAPVAPPPVVPVAPPPPPPPPPPVAVATPTTDPAGGPLVPTTAPPGAPTPAAAPVQTYFVGPFGELVGNGSTDVRATRLAIEQQDGLTWCEESHVLPAGYEWAGFTLTVFSETAVARPAVSTTGSQAPCWFGPDPFETWTGYEIWMPVPAGSSGTGPLVVVLPSTPELTFEIR